MGLASWDLCIWSTSNAQPEWNHKLFPSEARSCNLVRYSTEMERSGLRAAIFENVAGEPSRAAHLAAAAASAYALPRLTSSNAPVWEQCITEIVVASITAYSHSRMRGPWEKQAPEEVINPQCFQIWPAEWQTLNAFRESVQTFTLFPDARVHAWVSATSSAGCVLETVGKENILRILNWEQTAQPATSLLHERAVCKEGEVWVELMRQQKFWGQLAFPFWNCVTQILNLLFADLQLLLGLCVLYWPRDTVDGVCSLCRLPKRRKLPEDHPHTVSRLRHFGLLQNLGLVLSTERKQ